MQNGPNSRKYFGYTSNEWISYARSHKVLGYSADELLAFGALPIIKMAAVPWSQPLAKIGAIQIKSVFNESGPLNMWEASKQVLQKRGIKGFWDGTGIGTVREGSKASYKGGLQIVALDIADFIVPNDMYGSYLLKGIIAGGLTGAGDGMISTPGERYKNYKLTQDTNTNLFTFLKKIFKEQQRNSFFGNMQGMVRNELYRGVVVTVVKQSAMGIAFFGTNAWTQVVIAPYEKEHPYASMIFSCVASGAGAAVIGAPMKLAQTLVHQHTGDHNEGAIAQLRKVKAKLGWKGMLTGAPAQALLIMFGYSLNALFVNTYKKTFRNNPGHPGHPPKPPQSPAAQSANSHNASKEEDSGNALEKLTQQMNALLITQETTLDPFIESFSHLSLVENGDPHLLMSLSSQTSARNFDAVKLDDTPVINRKISECRM